MCAVRNASAWLWIAAWVGLCGCASAARPPANANAGERSGDTPAAESNAPPQLSAATWPEATAQFHTQHAWLGADSAYSVGLDEGHVLWLFADTFIDPAADGSRENGPNFFVRNSIAIQTAKGEDAAHDLSRSLLQFYWGPKQPNQQNAPSSFFHDADGGEEWIWPLHGARLPDGSVLLFRMRVVKEAGGLGFRVDSWDAVAIDEPLQAPDTWKPRLLTAKQRTFGKLVGSSVLIHDSFLYAYAVENQAPEHAIYLARWPLHQLTGLAARALDDPEWWTGYGFVQQSALRDGASPRAIFHDGQVELSVHYDPTRKQFIEIQMQGLFVADENTQIGARAAPRPEGPWSALEPFFRPSESALPNAADLAAYAVKAHPEQRGGGLVLTYVVNDLKRFPPGDRLYYPQVLRAYYPGSE